MELTKLKKLGVAFLCINLLYLQVEASTGSNNGSRIVGGEIAPAGQYGFFAFINVQTSTSKFHCGGALTRNQFIITSGHCVYNAELFIIQLGSNYLERDDANRVTVATSEYYLHPDFDPERIDNDIAVIKLRMAVTINAYIQPIYITPADHPDALDAIILGFGQMSDSEAAFSDELKYATVTTLPNAECQLVYGNQITSNHVCVSGNYNEGTCIGDNGGPLIYRPTKYFIMIGVASFISGNGCESTDPSGFTRVYPYKDWINNVTERYG